jgi:hypothetical protein
MPAADNLAWNLIQQQAAYQPDWTNYTNTANMGLQNYYNLMGQSYTQPGAQTVNPAYTAWLAQNGNNTGSGSGTNQQVNLFGGTTPWSTLINKWINSGIANKSDSTTAPAQYLTGESTTIAPTGVNYLDYLNQYLTGAFNPQSDDIYNTYLNRAVQGTRSGLSARGLNTSPYGAGIEGETSGEFARQWALDENNRRSTALQNYLAGQTGLQSLGQGALQQALSLETLKGQGWNQQVIENAMNYMGRQNTSGNNAAAQIIANQGAQAGQDWAQAGSNIADLIGSLNGNYNYYSNAAMQNAANSLEYGL